MNVYGKIAIGSLLVATSAPALAQSTATTNASATTTILSPISVTKVQDMVFGKIVRPANDNPNTVAVAASNGARTISGTGDGVLVGTAGTQAQFTVAGEGGAAITVTVPAQFALGPLTVTTAGTYPTAIGGTAGAAGSATINVGGSFPVTSATATGSYTGTLTVTAAYN